MVIIAALRLLVFAFGFVNEIKGEARKSRSHVRLLHDLLDKSEYDKRVRPVLDFRQPINVTMELELFQIIDVNEPAQFLQVYICIVQEWRDELLTWDPDQYDGLDTIILPHNAIWIPDTYLFNSLEMVREKSERWSEVVVKCINKNVNDSNGEAGSRVYFRYPTMYRFTCHMEIFYFPFDQQICNLTFGSWTYDIHGIDYFAEHSEVIMNAFTENQEWSVVEFKLFRELHKYVCCETPFALLQARLVLQRKPLYYVVNLIIPAFIVTLVSFVGFFTPDNSNGEHKDKVGLGISTLLAMSVLLMSLSDSMPTTSKYLPVMGVFYLCIIVFISLATLIACLLLMLESQGHVGRRIPKVVRRFCFFRLAPTMFMRIPSLLEKEENKDTLKPKRHDSVKMFHRLNNLSFSRQSSFNNEAQLQQQKYFATDDNINGDYLTALSCQLEKINCMIIDENRRRENVFLEWHWLAEILERFLLLLSIFALVFMTLILFFLSRH